MTSIPETKFVSSGGGNMRSTLKNKFFNRGDEICSSYCVSQISFRKRFINRIPPASTSGVHLTASIELGDCKTEVDSSLFGAKGDIQTSELPRGVQFLLHFSCLPFLSECRKWRHSDLIPYLTQIGHTIMHKFQTPLYSFASGMLLYIIL